MTTDAVKIVDMLMKREEAFVRIMEYERRVSDILGCAYPFPKPPELPSIRKKSSSAKKKFNELKLRNLRADEHAYRIRYLFKGQQRVTLQNNPTLIRDLAAIDVFGFTILSIETVAVNDDNTCNPIDLIWKNPDPQ